MGVGGVDPGRPGRDAEVVVVLITGPGGNSHAPYTSSNLAMPTSFRSQTWPIPSPMADGR